MRNFNNELEKCDDLYSFRERMIERENVDIKKVLGDKIFTYLNTLVTSKQKKHNQLLINLDNLIHGNCNDTYDSNSYNLHKKRNS